MVTEQYLRSLALSFPEATELPHFEKTSFRIRKKIFATYDAVEQSACMKLSLVHQEVFTKAGDGAIYPMPNKWGKRGWTMVKLAKVNSHLFAHALKVAYCACAPQKLAAMVNGVSAE